METNQTAPEAGPAPDDAKGDSASAGPPADGAAGSTSSGRSDAATPASATGPGFFAWLRRLGVPRRAGWLGGVCAGVAARLGIDPIIVRGIVVVAAVLGAPLVLLYAIAWLLLPDVDGNIHLERLLSGSVDPAVVGIAVMGVIGFLPLVQGGWLGWRWWPDWPTLPLGGIDVLAPLRVLWVLAIIAGVTALVIWLVRRVAQTSPGGGAAPRMASAPAAASGSPVVADPSGPTDASAASPPFAPSPDPSTEPPIPAQGADAATLAEWRAQHEAWRLSHAEWKAGQQDAERAARAQAAAENKAKARALAAQADEARAARRAHRPRASAAYVFTVLGLALVAAAFAAISALGPMDEFAPAIALAVATLVIAGGMFIAAVRRRRSGVLAFAAIVTTVLMLGNAVAPGATWVPWSIGESLGSSRTIVQPFGNAQLYPSDGQHDTQVEFLQGVGEVTLVMQSDERVRLDARNAGPVDVTWFNDQGEVTASQSLPDQSQPRAFGGIPGATPDSELVVRQWVGTVHVVIYESE